MAGVSCFSSTGLGAWLPPAPAPGVFAALAGLFAPLALGPLDPVLDPPPVTPPALGPVAEPGPVGPVACWELPLPLEPTPATVEPRYGDTRAPQEAKNVVATINANDRRTLFLLAAATFRKIPRSNGTSM